MNRIKCLFVLLICVVLAGCVTSRNKQPRSLTEQKTQPTQMYFKKAVLFERQKDFISAKENLLLAITADPSNSAAKQKLIQVNHQLQNLADTYYLKSKALHEKGKYSESNRFLLMTLRMWPDHFEARNTLMANQKLNLQKFVWYTIKKGETLSEISKTFYDTFDMSGIIAQVNDIKDATRIQAGTKIKIPELTDYPFINKKTMPSVEEQLTKVSDKEKKDTEPLQMYKDLGIEFFNDQQYENAVEEFKKVLNSNPSDEEAVTYISKSYYQLGLTANIRQDLLTAIKHFQDALKSNPDCAPCRDKITLARNTYMEQHYKAGMKFYDEQNLKMAILEWEHVQEMDPDYKKVTELLDKAKTIQKNIETIKKAEKP